MKVTTQPIAAPVLVVATFDFEELQPKLDKIWKKSKKDINMKGFRPGQVPRDIAEKKFGPESLYNSVFTEAISDACDSISEVVVGVRNLTLSAFDKEKNRIILSSYVDIAPEVELRKIEDVSINVPKLEAEPAQVTGKMLMLQHQHTQTVEIKEGVAEIGHTVEVKMTIFVDGKPFDGKTGETEMNVKLGDLKTGEAVNALLLNAVVGKEIKGKVDFEEDYFSPQLKGKTADVTAVVKKILDIRVPELDDKFAMSLGFGAIDALTEDCRVQVMKDLETQLETITDAEITNELVSANVIGPIPDSLIDRQVKTHLEDLAHRMGMTGATYLEKTRMTMETFADAQQVSLAMHRVEARLVLEAIFEKLEDKFAVSEEDIDGRIDEVSKEMKAPYDKINTKSNRARARLDIGTERAFKYVKSKSIAVVIEKPEEAKEPVG